ncbi:uncharacterized protein LOC144434876 [Glandiceps talaboti]
MNFLLGGTYPVPQPTTMQDKGKDLLTFVNVASSHIMRTLQKPKKGRSKKRNVNHRRFLEKQLSKKYSTAVVTNDTPTLIVENSEAKEIEKEKTPTDTAEGRPVQTTMQSIGCRDRPSIKNSHDRQYSDRANGGVYKKQPQRSRALPTVTYAALDSDRLVRSTMQQHASCVYKPPRHSNTQTHANIAYYQTQNDNYCHNSMQRSTKLNRTSSMSNSTITPMTTASEVVYDVDISGPHFQEITDILTPIFSEERLNCYRQDTTDNNNPTLPKSPTDCNNVGIEYQMTTRDYVDSSPASSIVSYSTEQSSEFDYDVHSTDHPMCQQQDSVIEYTELSPCMYNDLSGWISRDSNLSNLYDLTIQLLEQQKDVTCENVAIAANIGT